MLQGFYVTMNAIIDVPQVERSLIGAFQIQWTKSGHKKLLEDTLAQITGAWRLPQLRIRELNIPVPHTSMCSRNKSQIHWMAREGPWTTFTSNVFWESIKGRNDISELLTRGSGPSIKWYREYTSKFYNHAKKAYPK